MSRGNQPFLSVAQTGASVHATRMMGSGKTNAPQVAPGMVGTGYNTNNFAHLFAVTNTVGSVTNYLDAGGASNVPSRPYRVRIAP
ncbi:MAG: hypothetical protein ACLPT4_16385 [Verrucomicrobiia bacterium]